MSAPRKVIVPDVLASVQLENHVFGHGIDQSWNACLVDSTSPRYGEKANYYSAVCLETGEVEWMELEGNSNSGTSVAFLKQLREKHPEPILTRRARCRFESCLGPNGALVKLLRVKWKSSPIATHHIYIKRPFVNRSARSLSVSSGNRDEPYPVCDKAVPSGPPTAVIGGLSTQNVSQLYAVCLKWRGKPLLEGDRSLIRPSGNPLWKAKSRIPASTGRFPIWAPARGRETERMSNN